MTTFKTDWNVYACLVLGLVLGSGEAKGQGAAVREGGEVVLRSLGKYFGKTSAKEVADELAEYGGEAMVRRVTQKLAKEGGDEAIGRLSRVVGEFGPEALLAADNVASAGTVFRYLDEIPAESARTTLRRLSAGRGGQEFAEAIQAQGVKAIQAELKRPGIGTILVRQLGGDGVTLAESLTKEQAMSVAMHASDIAKLPEVQKQGVLALLRSDTERMVGFMGRFVEKNPGKTLFAASTTAIILAEPEKILGGDEVVLDAQGVPHLLSHPGLAGRVMDQASQSIVNPLMRLVVPLIAIALGLWLSIKLWGSYHWTRRRVRKNRMP